MSDHESTASVDHLAVLRARATRVRSLTAQLADAEKELRAEAVAARRGGELVADIQEVTGWSHQKVNDVLRAGGIPADRSAPRKRRTAH